jgi:hypothetical protein
MSPRKKKKLPLPRRKWTRSPVEKIHTATKKGKKYSREAERRRARREAEERP